MAWILQGFDAEIIGELINFLKNNNIDIIVKNRESRINTNTHKKADFKLEFTNEIYWS